MNLPDISQLAPVVDTTHNFLGFGIHKSQCRVKIWKDSGKFFVLFIDCNAGTSVTNAAEQLVEEVYKKHLSTVPKEDIIFAETYEDFPKENVDIIIPKWEGEKVTDVEWKHLAILINEKHK